MRQEQECLENAKNAGLLTRESEITFHKMMVSIKDSLTDIASLHNWEDGKDEINEETE
jgi:hypothetical protein